MASFLAWRGHLVHFVVFGLPVVGLVGALGLQEIRARVGSGRILEMRGAGTRLPEPRCKVDAPALRFATLGLIAAAAIHAAVIGEHFREDLFYGLFFSVVTALQLSLALMLSMRPTYRNVRYVAVTSALIVVLYVVSRTTGVPIGPAPWRPEAFGTLDIAATGAELVTLAGCAVQLGKTTGNARRLAHRLPGFTR
jgi:hypothetical protein